MRFHARFVAAIIIATGLILSFSHSAYALVGNPNAVGPELPDGGAGTNVVQRYGHKGVVSIINFPEYAPINTVPVGNGNNPITLRVWVNSGTAIPIATQYARQLSSVASSQ